MYNGPENNRHTNYTTPLQNTRVNVPLYERRKGKEFHASGSWKATKGEKILVEIFGGMFFFGIFIGLFMLLIHPGTLAFIVLGVGVIGAIGVFVSLFAIVLHKHKEQPMETHYYNTDYQYNAFKGQVTDNTREITKEEFYGKK